MFASRYASLSVGSEIVISSPLTIMSSPPFNASPLSVLLVILYLSVTVPSPRSTPANSPSISSRSAVAVRPLAFAASSFTIAPKLILSTCEIISAISLVSPPVVSLRVATPLPSSPSIVVTISEISQYTFKSLKDLPSMLVMFRYAMP